MHITAVAGRMDATAGRWLWIGRRVALALITGIAGCVAPALAGVDTWTSNGPYGAPVTALAVDAFGDVYAGIAGRGVYMSIDHGTTWQPMNIGLGNIYVQSLLVDPGAATTLYVASPDHGVFKSVDAGQTWLPASDGLPGRSAQHLAIDSATTTLFVSTEDGVFRSVDRAQSWSPTALAIHSEDDGLADVSLGAWIDCLTVDPATAALYACFFDWSGAHGFHWTLLRSSDAGATWDPVSLPGAGGPLAVTADGQGHLYVVLYDAYTLSSSVVESCDAGDTWHAMAGFDECSLDCRINALAIDASTAGTAYAATDHGMFMHDTDGASWQPLHTGMGARAATEVAADGRFLYAATGDGVFAMEHGTACPGDCNGDGAVSVVELVAMVELGMSRGSIDACRAGDADGNGTIDIADLVAAVARAMHGCGPA